MANACLQAFFAEALGLPKRAVTLLSGETSRQKVVRIEGAGDRAGAVFQGLKERGVLVKNISKMHPLLTNCLRLTVGTTEQNQQLLKALRDSL